VAWHCPVHRPAVAQHRSVLVQVTQHPIHGDLLHVRQSVTCMSAKGMHDSMICRLPPGNVKPEIASSQSNMGPMILDRPAPVANSFNAPDVQPSATAPLQPLPGAVEIVDKLLSLTGISRRWPSRLPPCCAGRHAESPSPTTFANLEKNSPDSFLAVPRTSRLPSCAILPPISAFAS